MENSKLGNTTSEKALGVAIDNKLNMSQQCETTATRAK